MYAFELVDKSLLEPIFSVHGECFNSSAIDEHTSNQLTLSSNDSTESPINQYYELDREDIPFKFSQKQPFKLRDQLDEKTGKKFDAIFNLSKNILDKHGRNKVYIS